jgi:hypothetical protein
MSHGNGNSMAHWQQYDFGVINSDVAMGRSALSLDDRVSKEATRKMSTIHTH